MSVCSVFSCDATLCSPPVWYPASPGVLFFFLFLVFSLICTLLFFALCWTLFVATLSCLTQFWFAWTLGFCASFSFGSVKLVFSFLKSCLLCVVYIWVLTLFARVQQQVLNWEQWNLRQSLPTASFDHPTWPAGLHQLGIETAPGQCMVAGKWNGQRQTVAYTFTKSCLYQIVECNMLDQAVAVSCCFLHSFRVEFKNWPTWLCTYVTITVFVLWLCSVEFTIFHFVMHCYTFNWTLITPN